MLQTVARPSEEPIPLDPAVISWSKVHFPVRDSAIRLVTVSHLSWCLFLSGLGALLTRNVQILPLFTPRA